MPAPIAAKKTDGKQQPSFACQSCGAVYNRWKGKCEACGGWNTITEETGREPLPGPAASARHGQGPYFPARGSFRRDAARRGAPPSGIGELHCVMGGVFVRGSDPARRRSRIGKSILLIQAGRRARHARGNRIAYISGEEAVAQARLRAERSASGNPPVELASETNVEDIVAT